MFLSRRAASLVIVYLTVFIDTLGNSLITPILPFLALKFDADGTQVGLLFASYSATATLSVLLMGPASDRLGRRPIVLLSLLGSAAGLLAQGFAWDFLSLVAFRAATGLFAGTTATAQAYIADDTSRDDRAKYMAFLGSTIAVAFLFGPAVGAGLSQFSLQMPMFVAGAISFLGFLLALVFLREPQRVEEERLFDADDEETAQLVVKGIRDAMTPEEEDASASDSSKDDGGKDETSSSSSSSSSLSSSSSSLFAQVSSTDEDMDEEDDPTFGRTAKIAIVLCCSTNFIFNLAFSAFQALIGLLLQGEHGVSSLQLGFAFSTMAIVFVTAQNTLFTFLRKHFPLSAIGASSLVVVGLGLLTISLSRVLWVALVGMGILILGNSCVAPALPALLSFFAAKDKMGKTLSLGSVASSAGRVVGPIAFGAMYAEDVHLPFSVAAGTAWCAGVVLACLVHVQYKQLQHNKEVERQRMYARGELPPPRPPTTREIHALGHWLNDVLVARGYRRWNDHLPQMERHLSAAFPPVNDIDDVRFIFARVREAENEYRVNRMHAAVAAETGLAY